MSDLAGGGVADSVDFAITVDGSDDEIDVTRDYPSSKIGFLRVAGSLLRLNDLRAADMQPFVDSARLRKAYEHSSFDAALPSNGVNAPGLSARDTWRSEVNHFMTSTVFDPESQKTLADMLLAIHGAPGSPVTELSLRVCPVCSKRYEPGSEAKLSRSGGTCSDCGAALFITDVLRTADEWVEEGSNITALTRLMNVSERLTTLSYVEALSEAQSGFALLKRFIFITDGPLALFGTVAPLKRRVWEYHDALFVKTSAAGVLAPLLVGIEKSGAIWEHAQQIKDFIHPGEVMLITNDYMNRVTGRPEGNHYGRDEFYGRRFFYRTSMGDVLVITVPPGAGIEPYAGPQSEDFASYPTLRPICEVLDAVRTRMYPNAVIPVALAHNAASLPLGIGRSVLRALSQSGLGIPVNRQVRQQPPRY